MVHIQYFWQDNQQKYTVMYGAYTRFWPTLVTCYMLI